MHNHFIRASGVSCAHVYQDEIYIYQSIWQCHVKDIDFNGYLFMWVVIRRISLLFKSSWCFCDGKSLFGSFVEQYVTQANLNKLGNLTSRKKNVMRSVIHNVKFASVFKEPMYSFTAAIWQICQNILNRKYIEPIFGCRREYRSNLL